MTPADEANPYAAPTAPIRERRRERGLPLASLGDRFLGAIVDSIFHFAFLFVGGIFAGGYGVMLGEEDPSDGTLALLAIVGAIGVPVLIQWGLLWSRSQTIGKIVMKTRIDLADGDGPAGPGRTIGLRYIPLMIAQLLIPFIGIIDAVVIFAGQRRQCLHDMVAGTVVRKVA